MPQSRLSALLSLLILVLYQMMAVWKRVSPYYRQSKAFFVLLLFLRDLWGALIVATAIPVSVVVTFSVMYAADVTLNIISMAGLALAIGMLVDVAHALPDRNLFGEKHAPVPQPNPLEP